MNDKAILRATIAMLDAFQGELKEPSMALSEVIDKAKEVQQRWGHHHIGCPVCGLRTQDD